MYFALILLKGEILWYCKDLIASLENNYVLVEWAFHNVPSEDEDFEH